jgi:hypothetical protein
VADSPIPTRLNEQPDESIVIRRLFKVSIKGQVMLLDQFTKFVDQLFFRQRGFGLSPLDRFDALEKLKRGVS